MEKVKRFERILSLIDEKKFAEAKEILVEMNEMNIATLLNQVDDEERLLMFRLLPKDLAADVFAFLDTDNQQLIVSTFSDLELASLLSELFVDDLADLVEEMPANVASKILKNTDANDRKTINQILQYPEDSAGSLLTTEYIRLKKQQTVAEALQTIRKYGLKSETIYTCYVTDEKRILEGILSLRELVLADPETLVGEIMTTDFVCVNTHDDQEYVAMIFKNHGFIALPVVDSEKRLVGIITVDDILDALEAETTEDFQKMAAMQPSEERYLDTSVFVLSKHRIFWLLLLMLTETFTGGIIEYFTEVLQKCVLLTAFIPVLMDTGGNAGSQSSTLIIRGLATKELSTKDLGKILWKELRIGIVVSVILGTVMFMKNVFFGNKGVAVSLTVSCAIMTAVIISKLTGAFLPILAKKLKLDPATMAAPIITTIVDTVSLIVYFSFAKLFIPELSM